MDPTPAAHGYDVPIDELPVMINPIRVGDLKSIIVNIAPVDRPRMALAFADITFEKWADTAGVGRVNVWRWITRRECRLPFGAAARLAHVLGVPMQELFADWMR